MNITLDMLLTFVFFAPIALMVAMNLVWLRNPGYEFAPLAATPSDPVSVDNRFVSVEAANEGEERRAA